MADGDKGRAKLEWLRELRTLDRELKDADLPDVMRGSLEQRLEAALHNLEVYEEELRVQNDELIAARGDMESSLKKYAALFVNSPFGYFIVDEGRLIREANLTGAEMFGQTRAHLIGKPFLLYADAEHRNALDAHFRAVFSGEKATAEIRLGGQDGQPLTVIIESRPVSHGLGEGTHSLTAISDITERKQAEEGLKEANRQLFIARGEAERANRAKSDFLATMSHELRTPLNAILGFSDVIRGETLGPLTPVKYLEYAGDIHASGKHLLELINDILDLSKIEAGKLTITPETLSVRTVFQDCSKFMKEQAAQKGVSLKCAAAAEIPDLRADKRALVQILFNLVGNAVRFTPKGGTISVDARPLDDGGVQVSVSDTGSGIPDEHLERIMLPFERIEGIYSRDTDGTGLGLSISKSLMELHGGSLAIDSAVGKGTTVFLQFPPEG